MLEALLQHTYVHIHISMCNSANLAARKPSNQRNLNILMRTRFGVSDEFATRSNAPLHSSTCLLLHLLKIVGQTAAYGCCNLQVCRGLLLLLPLVYF